MPLKILVLTGCAFAAYFWVPFVQSWPTSQLVTILLSIGVGVLIYGLLILALLAVFGAIAGLAVWINK